MVLWRLFLHFYRVCPPGLTGVFIWLYAYKNNLKMIPKVVAYRNASKSGTLLHSVALRPWAGLDPLRLLALALKCTLGGMGYDTDRVKARLIIIKSLKCSFAKGIHAFISHYLFVLFPNLKLWWRIVHLSSNLNVLAVTATSFLPFSLHFYVNVCLGIFQSTS